MDIEDESDDASGRLHNLDHKVNKLCCQWPDSDVTVDSEIIDLRVTINGPVESLSFVSQHPESTPPPKRQRYPEVPPAGPCATGTLTGSLPPGPQCSFQPG